MGKNKNGIFAKLCGSGSNHAHRQDARKQPIGRVPEFQEDKPYIELCWEAEQDARFLLGMAGDRNSFIMRAEPVTTAEEGTRSPLGSPLKKSYMPKGEIKTKSIYSQVKNNRDTFLDNRASFLAYRPSKNDLVQKSSRNHKRLFTTILGKPTTPRRGRIPASRCKSDSEAYSYSQAYSTKTSPPDDGIDHLEDLRLTLLSWTTATHESFVGSSSLSCEELGRTSNDIGVTSEQHKSVKREADRRYAPGTSPSATIGSGQRSRYEDVEGIDDEVARIMGGTSHPTASGSQGSQRSRSAQDDRDSLFEESSNDSIYDAQRLSHMRRMNEKTNFSKAMRTPMTRYNFMVKPRSDARIRR